MINRLTTWYYSNTVQNVRTRTATGNLMIVYTYIKTFSDLSYSARNKLIY